MNIDWLSHWYRSGKSWLAWLLWPLSLLYCTVVQVRRLFYTQGWLKQARFDTPVVVVGNITLGGTGKTPLVVELVRLLRQAGYNPGLVSRGYGGNSEYWPQPVTKDSDPVQVGDEPVFLVQKTACPMSVGPNRPEAVRQLLIESPEVDVVISDDGLQHYALARQVEMVVIHGERGFGNGECLPAGPLREPVSRLHDAHIIVSHGVDREGCYSMNSGLELVESLLDPEQKTHISRLKGMTVHGVAGIGHPEGFFQALRAEGLEVIEHAFDDHHDYVQGDLDFGDDLPVMMTEKDAVKCRHFADERHWSVSQRIDLEDACTQHLFQLLGNSQRG